MTGKRRLRWTKHSDLAIKRRPCVSREEYLDYMTFRRNERPLFTEIFGPIIGLKEEWADQGATPEELDFSAFEYRCPRGARVAVNVGFMGGPDEVVLDENDEYTIFRDRMGRTMKLPRAYATLALPLDYPVKTMDDWLAVKHHYAFSEERFAPDWEARANDAIQARCVLSVSMLGAFAEPRELMGDEAVCIAYYDQPELLHDMVHTFGDTAQRVLDRASKAVQVDCLSVHEDMAGKSGPLAGPKQVREFFVPYYRRIWDMLADRGARLFDQDSDGDMNAVIEPFLEAGVNCMHPMEPAAGMDIVEVRRTYGRRLAFYGGIDKHVIRRSHKEITAELEYKIPPMVASGGCMLALDHRIPNGTPLANYRFYIAKAWEIMNREAARACDEAST